MFLIGLTRLTYTGVPEDNLHECTIYRKDKIFPIVSKEYLEEVRTDKASWRHIPRLMLRHRVIWQRAKLAFNISSSNYSLLQSLDRETEKNSVSRNISNIKQINVLKARLKNDF